MTHAPPASGPVHAAGPFAEQHAALRTHVDACLLRLDEVRRVLLTVAPAGMHAARAVEWRGPAAAGMQLIAEGSEVARAALVDGVSSAHAHYRSASAKLEATA